VNGETRYLTYEAWPGQLNNTRMCFETALVLAFLSRRCLVTPPVYRLHHEPEWDNGRFRPLHPQECFELGSLNAIMDVISRDEYERRLGAIQADTADLVVEPGMAVFCFPNVPAAGSPEGGRLRDFAAGRRIFLEFTPRMQACRTLNLKSATLEHFYSFFYFSRKSDQQQCKRLIRDYVRFKAVIISIAARIAAALGTYSALHARRTDFSRQHADQDISPDRLLASLKSRIPERTRLYISTDEPNKAFFSKVRDRYEVYFLDDFRSVFPAGIPSAWLACVEQMVCAFALLFMGTRLSTFSAYITRLRGYYGAPDKNIYFSDGYPGGEMDSQGSPPFSWINWIRNGNPWWGREFREGWELSS
jgi:hypothetical protein